MKYRPFWRSSAVLVAVVSVVVWGAIATLPPLNPLGSVALAQRIRPDGVWQTIYEKLPYLPLENQYVNKETKQAATDNTLIGRLIRYHLYTKGRPPFFRLDWKVTLADYLGVSGNLDETTYPSRDTLRSNPMEGDVAAIRKLTRQQRDELIQALVDAFTPQSGIPPQLAPTQKK